MKHRHMNWYTLETVTHGHEYGEQPHIHETLDSLPIITTPDGKPNIILGEN